MMSEWFFAANVSLAVFNAAMFWRVYWPAIFLRYGQNFRTLMLLHSIFKSWKNVCYCVAKIVEYRIKQYMANTCVALDRTRYKLIHVIDNGIVNVVVMPRKNKVVDVLNERGESVYDSYKNYLSFETVEFASSMVNEKGLILMYENGDVKTV